jgi:hypothetical protein
MLKSGHKVSLICLTQYPIESDVRIRQLSKNKEFHIHAFQFLPRNSGKSNLETGSIRFSAKIFREAVFNQLFATIFLKINQFDGIIFTWGRPRAKGFQRQLFRAAKFLSVPTICIPHGQNIYINYDVNQQLRTQYNKLGSWPDFSERNEFSKYVVQSARHRQQHIDWGMDPDTVVSWGSLRFDPSWLSFNSKLYRPYKPQSRSEVNQNLSIVLFLPHWRYNVDETLTVELIKLILDHIECQFIVKGHTRGDRLNDEMMEMLEPYDNIDLNSQQESTPLIDWSDVVINFGSSIAIEAIVKRKHVIYPSYLHTNKTIFDNQTCVFNCRQPPEVITKLGSLVEQPSYRSKDYEISRQSVISSEIFNQRQRSNMAKIYLNNILQLTLKAKITQAQY